MTGIVIYRSTYGSTKQYAEWIHEETGFPLFDSRDPSIPWNVSTIVIGCPIVAFKPMLGGWIQKHWDKFHGKRVFLFTTSGADPAKEPVLEWIEKALPDEVKQGARVFPLAGRFDFARATGLHKFMLRLAAIILRSEAIKHQIQNPIDGVSRTNLKDLLAAIEGQP
jgi:menaquinone-dependent protoporphyrinogen IX oxidase